MRWRDDLPELEQLETDLRARAARRRPGSVRRTWLEWRADRVRELRLESIAAGYGRRKRREPVPVYPAKWWA